MIFSFEVPAGVSLRLGTDATALVAANDAAVAGTSIGLGYTWWTGGAGLKTSLSTNYDMVMDSAGAEDSVGKLSLNVSFGF